MKLKFYGYSDDVACYNDGVADEEVDCAETGRQSFNVLNSNGNGIRISLRYGDVNATWGAAVRPYAEDEIEPKIPDGWTISISNSPDVEYSVQVLVDTGHDEVNVFQV